MKPRILFYDIETSPNIGYVWGKYEQNVLSYLAERELLSVAFKWQGDMHVQCITRQGRKSDRTLVKRVHKLFQEADLVIAHNGDSFDQKIVKSRMVYHRLSPPRILQSVDTRKAAKQYFGFNGNGLDDLGQFLKLGRKVKHPGFDMWLGCLAGKKESWKQMIKYNKQDVVLLEKVYGRLKPWIHNHPAVGRSSSKRPGSVECPICSSPNVHKRGTRLTQSTIKQQWQCQDCHSWHLTPMKKEK